MILANKLKELHAYIDKWGEDVRKELSLSESSESTIGISFMPEMVLKQMPTWEIVKQDIYRITIDNGISIFVLVTEQNPNDGTVIFERLDTEEPGKRFCSMSYSIFARIAVIVPCMPYPIKNQKI